MKTTSRTALQAAFADRLKTRPVEDLEDGDPVPAWEPCENDVAEGVCGGRVYSDARCQNHDAHIH